jgi:TRAP transporter TAXI family solute receptor
MGFTQRIGKTSGARERGWIAEAAQPKRDHRCWRSKGRAMSSFKRCACFTTIAVALFSMTSTGMAGQKEVDPAKVSEDLKALFNDGSDIRKTKERLNPNTVTIMTGPVGGTDERIGADLASALDDGEDLRVLPIVGRGSAQSVADVLFLNNVDVGITRSDSLDYLEKKGYSSNLKDRLTYIAKLFNEEMHVVAPKVIEKLADLEGKTVSVNDGGAFITVTTVFERLGIKPKFVIIDETRAFEKLRKGEIDAVAAIQGSPWTFTAEIKNDRFHFVPIEYAAPLQADYLPAQLTAKDYPALIGDGERVDTIAVPTLLTAYDWDTDSERYGRIARFVKAFFGKFKELQEPPFHPKWREVVLSAPLKGWKRFPTAQEWLDEHSNGAMSETRRQFDRFMAMRGFTAGTAPTAALEQNAALYKEFLEWQKESDAKAPPRRSRAARKHRTSRAKNRAKAEDQTAAENPAAAKN